MGHANGIITAPINTDDISSVIGVPSHDVVTLGLHDKNNKWSKHKPVRGESPVDFDSWTAATGRVREASGFPIVWGMMLPFNTALQLGLASAQRWLKPLALRVINGTGSIKNYEYARPVAGTDFVRMTDYDGYNHNAPQGWTAGVQGAVVKADAPGEGMLIQVDAFDTAEIGFYIGMPAESISDSCLSFKDLFSSQGYRFIVELYKNDQSFTNDSSVPVAVLVATKDIASMDYGVNFSILVSRINTLFGFSGDGEKTLYAITGVVRFSANPTLTEEKRADNTGLGCAVLSSADYAKIVNGEGSIPPWTASFRPFLCQIKLHSYSKITIQPTAYALPTSTSYSTLPSTAINYSSDGIRLKATVSNKGTSAVTLNGTSTNSPRFQIQAHGAYDTSHPSYSAMCDSPADGKWHDVTVSSASNFSANSGITINAGASNTNVYMQCLGFMPIGRTSSFTMRVSTDGGVTWVITASFSGGFIVS